MAVSFFFWKMTDCEEKLLLFKVENPEHGDHAGNSKDESK